MKTGQCRCLKCAKLCHGKPGFFKPGEARAAAKELKLSLRAFFTKFLTRDFYVGDYDVDEEGDHSTRTYLLSPAWMGNNGQTAQYGDVLKRGPCALLGPTGCRLSSRTRPFECRMAFGCDPQSRDALYAQQDQAVVEWKKNSSELDELAKSGALDLSDDGGVRVEIDVSPLGLLASMLLGGRS